MGLDIYHEKATMTAPTIEGVHNYNSQIVLEDEYEGFNVPFNHFRKYIQEVDYKIEVHTIIIVENILYLPSTKLHFNDTDYTIFPAFGKESLQSQIRNYEREKKIDDLQITLQPANEYRPWQIKEYYYTVKRSGFYIEEVGYQRKGMNNDFDVRFDQEDIVNFAL